MKKTIYQTPECEVVEIEIDNAILGTSDWDPSAPIIIEPSQPDPSNPPAPAF